MSDQQLWIPATQHRRAAPAKRAAQMLGDGPRAPSRFRLHSQNRSAPAHAAALASDASTAVILATGSQRLRDEVARIAAAAGITLEVLPTAAAALTRNPEVLLLGSDLAASGLPGRRQHSRLDPRGSETILVGTGQEAGLWQDAARLEAARVAVLPDASAWLAEFLSRRRSHASGFVLGVIGGSGGAGASTLSCWLAHEAAEQGMSTLLVDGDPCGGGLDTSLGSSEVPGVRWPDLADVRGALNPVQFVSALPHVSGFALLSGVAEPADSAETGYSEEPSGDPNPESSRAVMDAARAAFTLTIVDCASNRSGRLLLSCDALLVVVLGRLRPVLAARSLHRSLGTGVPKAAVIRGPLGDGLDDARAADSAGLPLAGYLPHARNLEHAEARGLLLERGRRRNIRRVTGQLVGRLAPELAGPAAAAAEARS